MTISELREAVMSLPEPERRALGLELLDSTDPAAQGDPAEVEAAWDEEIARRIDKYRRGESRLLTEDEVRDILGR
jgi:putative addiction module component (TIGR02574 family)